MAGLRIGLGLAGAFFCLLSTPAAGQTVKWEIEDRFRLFGEGDAAAKEKVKDLLSHLADPKVKLDDQHNPILDALTDPSAATLRRSHYRPTDRATPGGSGRYDRRYLYPEHYTISAWMEDAPPGALCTWRTPVETRRSPCEQRTSVRIADGASVSRNDWRVDQPLFVAVDGGTELKPEAIRFRDRLIVAMGDSYISGEGNPDVPSIVTDRLDKRRAKIFSRPSWGSKLDERKGDYRRAQWWDERCHRSLLSWPVLASLAYSARKTNEAVTLVHLGCSGAIVGDLIDRGEVELPGGGGDEPYAEPQLVQLKDLILAAPAGWERRKPDRLLLSVGGNDIGFVGVIKTITLPPNGFTLGGLGARLVGKEAEAVCPYDDSGSLLRRLCGSQRSAQDRLKELPKRYEELARALDPVFAAADVYQFTYPNPLLGKDGKPCRSADEQGNRLYDSGFNSLMGVVDRIGRGIFYRSWNFEISYYEERVWGGDYLIPNSQVRCDTGTDPSDSEVCQALWVHRTLNDTAKANHHRHWSVISSHTSAIDGHGICLADEDFRLRLPLISQGTWEEGWTPLSFKPYDKKLPRWFRVTNDSAVTQYGDRKHFHHGTIHPTFRAHLAYAQAALDEAFPVPEPLP